VQYTLSVRNPTASAVTFNLTAVGIPASWLQNLPGGLPALPASVVVPAQGAVNLPFAIIPNATVPSGTYTFQVIANAIGIYGAVEGTLVFTNTPIVSPVGPGTPVAANTSNAVVQVTPASGTAGPGTSALFQVSVTNVGPSPDTFELSAYANFVSGLPPALQSTFDNAEPVIAPGATFTASLSMKVPLGTPPQAVPFTVYAYGQAYGGQGQGQASVNVVANGLTLTLNPNSTVPNGTLPLTVTNTGSVSDTFNLSLAGPAALVATLPSNSAALTAGASQTLNIAAGNPTFATMGNLPLQVIGTSKANSAVTALVNGTIVIPASLGVTAAFQPASQSAPSSGAAVFPLVVQNTGTIQDGYTAAITGTTGQVQASLVGLDGNPTQSIPEFLLPGVATGQLFLNLTSTGLQGGAATVKITSLTNASVTASATATITGSAPAQPPVANAGSTANIPIHHNAVLDGTGSYDPTTPALTYAWTVTSVPAGSSIANSSIRSFPSYPRAAFTPDVSGAYAFTLTVSNGQKSATASVTLVASHFPPVAIAGKAQNAKTGTWVLLNGKNSYDPDEAPITFAWFVDTVPQGSKITTASLYNSATPKPFFEPDVDGDYNLRLVVTDSVASSAPSAITINRRQRQRAAQCERRLRSEHRNRPSGDA
jgi:hypothetical protein